MAVATLIGPVEISEETLSAWKKGDYFFKDAMFAEASFFYQKASNHRNILFRFEMSMKMFDSLIRNYEYDEAFAIIEKWDLYRRNRCDIATRRLIWMIHAGKLWEALSWAHHQAHNHVGSRPWRETTDRCFQSIEYLEAIFHYLDRSDYKNVFKMTAKLDRGLHFFLIRLECCIETEQYGKAHFYAYFVQVLTQNDITKVKMDPYLMTAMWKYFKFLNIENKKADMLCKRINASRLSQPKQRMARILKGATKVWEANRYTQWAFFEHPVNKVVVAREKEIASKFFPKEIILELRKLHARAKKCKAFTVEEIRKARDEILQITDTNESKKVLLSDLGLSLDTTGTGSASPSHNERLLKADNIISKLFTAKGLEIAVKNQINAFADTENPIPITYYKRKQHRQKKALQRNIMKSLNSREDIFDIRDIRCTMCVAQHAIQSDDNQLKKENLEKIKMEIEDLLAELQLIFNVSYFTEKRTLNASEPWLKDALALFTENEHVTKAFEEVGEAVPREIFLFSLGNRGKVDASIKDLVTDEYNEEAEGVIVEEIRSLLHQQMFAYDDITIISARESDQAVREHRLSFRKNLISKRSLANMDSDSCNKQMMGRINAVGVNVLEEINNVKRDASAIINKDHVENDTEADAKNSIIHPKTYSSVAETHVKKNNTSTGNENQSDDQETEETYDEHVSCEMEYVSSSVPKTETNVEQFAVATTQNLDHFQPEVGMNEEQTLEIDKTKPEKAINNGGNLMKSESDAEYAVVMPLTGTEIQNERLFSPTVAPIQDLTPKGADDNNKLTQSDVPLKELELDENISSKERRDNDAVEIETIPVLSERVAAQEESKAPAAAGCNTQGGNSQTTGIWGSQSGSAAAGKSPVIVQKRKARHNVALASIAAMRQTNKPENFSNKETFIQVLANRTGNGQSLSSLRKIDMKPVPFADSVLINEAADVIAEKMSAIVEDTKPEEIMVADDQLVVVVDKSPLSTESTTITPSDNKSFIINESLLNQLTAAGLEIMTDNKQVISLKISAKNKLDLYKFKP